jgi:hypothetical protein
MIRTIAVAVASLVLGAQAAWADLIPGSKNNVAGWDIGAYTRGDKFSHCAMSTLYRSGITMVFSVSGDYTWRVGWAHDSWSFSKGQSVPVDIYVDNVGPISLRANAVTAKLALAELPPKAALFHLLRRGNRMTVRAGGASYAFNLDGTYAALTETLACAERYEAVASSSPRSPMPRQQTAPPQPERNARGSTAEERLEATKIVANILSQGELSNFRILTAREIAELKSGYLSSSDVVWRAEGIIGTLRIIASSTNATARQIASAVVADDTKNCKGQSVSGSTKDQKNPEVVRLFTGCQDGDAAYQFYYTIVPLDDGAFYLFATAAKVGPGGKSEGAKVEALLRDAVFDVMGR